MKTEFNITSTARLAGSVFVAVLSTNIAHADSASWTGAVNGSWADVNNWAGPPASVPGAGQVATFNSGSAAGVIDLGAGVTISQLSFQASAPSLTIGAGAVNSQTLALTSTGDGITGGGGSAGQTLTINAALTIAGANPRFFNISQPTVNINGSLTTSHTSGTTMLRLNDSGISLNGVVSNGASANLGLQLQQNTYTLGNAGNTFTGGILLENATVNVGSISMTGLPSAAGAGGTIGFGNVFGNGRVNYTGTGDTTNRPLGLVHGLNGGIVTHSGTGLLKFTSDVPATGLSGSPTLQLQGSTAGTGEISGAISDHATIGTTTNRNAVANGAASIQLYSVAGIEIGSAVSGSANIPAGTTVTAINTATRTITLSQATTGAVAQNLAISIEGVYNPTSVLKSGTGTWVLSGDNTYTGTATVSGGTLVVDGSLANSPTTIQNNGTLKGSGSIGGSVTINGGATLASGNSIGSLGVGALRLLAGSTFAYELQTDLYAGTPNVAGDLTYSTGTLDISAGAILTLTDLATSTALAPGSKLTLISYFGGWAGDELFTYQGNTLADGEIIALGANQWLFDYNDPTGGLNYSADQAGATSFVTMTVIPEPSTALLAGLGALALLRRRRR